MIKPELILVDDDPDDIYLLESVCEELESPPKLTTFTNGSDFLYYARNQDRLNSLILLDLNMPNLSGLDVLKQLKAENKVNLFYIIVYTTSKNDKDIADAMSQGAKSFICKPDTKLEIKQLITNLLDYWYNTNVRM
ncbi:hypothetical protein C2869_00590 [Saccharobesus litoralis]|uniref:Response regulatory domain-containing protein n=1 Tax=Saccharobesus litoralis TaxID=2172099 RepID=A0A2S0VLE3_9ALTE|nr:response regulator [Saccharobesus litoralis]AWB65029.1 hypothetical protein C2869_00590 [Saccharobesus litoralis]